jgi:hypothetical protein
MGWVVNATPRPFYPRGRPGTHCIGGWVGRAPGPVWRGAENLAPTGIRSPDRPALSESLGHTEFPFLQKNLCMLTNFYAHILNFAIVCHTSLKNKFPHLLYSGRKFCEEDWGLCVAVWRSVVRSQRCRISRDLLLLYVRCVTKPSFPFMPRVPFYFRDLAGLSEANRISCRVIADCNSGRYGMLDLAMAWVVSSVRIVGLGSRVWHRLPVYYIYIKVKQSRYRPGVAQRVPGS